MTTICMGGMGGDYDVWVRSLSQLVVMMCALMMFVMMWLCVGLMTPMMGGDHCCINVGNYVVCAQCVHDVHHVRRDVNCVCCVCDAWGVMVMMCVY